MTTIVQECTVTDCPSDARNGGMCWGHYNRQRRYGDPLHRPFNGTRPGAASPSWKGDGIDYGGAHKRTSRTRGAASDHQCRCGAPAQEWALLKGRTPTGIDTKGRTYSADPNDYMPMCCRCHRRYDNHEGGSGA